MDSQVFNAKTLWRIGYFNNDHSYLLIVGYCFLQPVFRMWTKYSNFYENHKEFCKKMMAGYNLIMTIFSFLCAVTMIHCLMNLEKGVYSTGHFEDKGVGQTYSNVTYYFYVSKYIEFLDTYFFILHIFLYHMYQNSHLPFDLVQSQRRRMVYKRTASVLYILCQNITLNIIY